MFSNSILITDFTLTDNSPVYQNQTWTGQIITRNSGINFFTISFKVQTTKDNRAELQRFQAEHSLGRPFKMSLGWYSQYSGEQEGAVLVTAPVAVASYKIPVSNNKLEVGTLIQFSSTTKLYKVLANTGTELSIYPSLRKPISGGEVIKFNNLTGTFILTNDNNKTNYVSENIISMDITATEDVTG
ncbi:hypothetical protein FG446_003755 [Yersinia enterocolitica]|nr:hypothetical protein [Yersinia enterocolitica]